MQYVLVKNAGFEVDEGTLINILTEGEVVYESDDYHNCLDRIPHPLSISSCFGKYCLKFRKYYSAPTDDEFHLFVAYVEKRISRCSAYIHNPTPQSEREFYDWPFGPSVLIPNSLGMNKEYYPPTDSNRVIFKRVKGNVRLRDYADCENSHIPCLPAIHEKICREKQLSLLCLTHPPSTFFEREILMWNMDNIIRFEFIRWLENVVNHVEDNIDSSAKEIEIVIESLMKMLAKPAPTEFSISEEAIKEELVFETLKEDSEIYFDDHPASITKKSDLGYEESDRNKFGISYSILVRESLILDNLEFPDFRRHYQLPVCCCSSNIDAPPS